MNQKTGHPALDQHIPIFMEVILRGNGLDILVYDLTREKEKPIGIWYINWKGIMRAFWSTLTGYQCTVYAGMSVGDLQAYTESGDRPLGYDG